MLKYQICRIKNFLEETVSQFFLQCYHRYLKAKTIFILSISRFTFYLFSFFFSMCNQLLLFVIKLINNRISD